MNHDGIYLTLIYSFVLDSVRPCGDSSEKLFQAVYLVFIK